MNITASSWVHITNLKLGGHTLNNNNLWTSHSAGYKVPKDWNVMVILGAIHKSADYFPDPLKFDPSRFEVSFNKHLTVCLLDRIASRWSYSFHLVPNLLDVVSIYDWFREGDIERLWMRPVLRCCWISSTLLSTTATVGSVKVKKKNY